MYTHKNPEGKLTVNLALELVKICDYYQVLSLKKYCGEVLSTSIEKTNVVDITVLARRYGLLNLSESCFNFMLSLDFSGVPQIENLEVDDWEFVLRSENLRYPELLVFQCIVEWGKLKLKIPKQNLEAKDDKDGKDGKDGKEVKDSKDGKEVKEQLGDAETKDMVSSLDLQLPIQKLTPDDERLAKFLNPLMSLVHLHLIPPRDLVDVVVPSKLIPIGPIAYAVCAQISTDQTLFKHPMASRGPMQPAGPITGVVAMMSSGDWSGYPSSGSISGSGWWSAAGASISGKDAYLIYDMNSLKTVNKYTLTFGMYGPRRLTLSQSNSSDPNGTWRDVHVHDTSAHVNITNLSTPISHTVKGFWATSRFWKLSLGNGIFLNPDTNGWNAYCIVNLNFEFSLT